jgi:hypothetical protein
VAAESGGFNIYTYMAKTTLGVSYAAIGAAGSSIEVIAADNLATANIEEMAVVSSSGAITYY